MPNGCTTAEVILNIEGKELGINKRPIPIPPATIFETSKNQPATQEEELFIYNIYGQEIKKSYFFDNAEKQLWNLQQNELPTGIYFYIKRSRRTNKIIESGKVIAISR